MVGSGVGFGLVGPVGFDVADRQAGGSAHSSCFLVVELDGEDGVADVHGDGAVGVVAAESDDLAADTDAAGVAGPALNHDRLGRWPGWWAGRSGTSQASRLVGGQRVRSDAQQLAGGGIEEHQHRRFDSDGDLAAAQVLGHHGTDRGDTGFRQAGVQFGFDLLFPGHLEEAIHLHRTREDQYVNRPEHAGNRVLVTAELRLRNFRSNPNL